MEACVILFVINVLKNILKKIIVYCLNVLQKLASDKRNDRQTVAGVKEMIIVHNEKEFEQAVKKAEKGEIIWWDERFEKEAKK